MATARDDAGSTEERYDAGPFVPDSDELGVHESAAEACRGCPLHRDTTGVVFGAGPGTATLMLVGEQPGDVEDRRRAPFVGPAGRVLRQCLDGAGVPVEDVYLTNAVKHFKHHREGKRRIHDRPSAAEIEACHPWLAAELMLVRPAAVVALGATAARSLAGRAVRIEANLEAVLREQQLETPLLVTFHPSAALRRRGADGDTVRQQIESSIAAAHELTRTG